MAQLPRRGMISVTARRGGMRRGLLARLVVYLGAGSVLLHGLDSVQGGLLTLVGLTRGDDLPVASDEIEVVLAAGALLQHELARHVSSSTAASRMIPDQHSQGGFGPLGLTGHGAGSDGVTGSPSAGPVRDR